jgi:hypothetical protein
MIILQIEHPVPNFDAWKMENPQARIVDVVESKEL